MKRNLILFFVVLFLLPTIFGCKKTPDVDSVVNKAEASYSEQTELSPYEAPDNWQETIENGNITYRLDSNIVIPNVLEYPVYEVLPSTFDYKELDFIINQLVPEHQIRIENVDIMTRNQIQDEMDIITMSIDRVDENHPEFSDQEKADYISSRQQDLAAMQALYNATPENIESQLVSSVADLNVEGSNRTTARIYNAAGTSDLICELGLVKTDSRTAVFGLYPSRSYDITTHSFVEITPMPMPRLTLSSEEIEKRANEFIKYIGLDESYSLNSIYTDMSFYDGKIAVFTPSYGGISSTYAIPNTLSQAYNETLYARIWHPENVMVYFDAAYNVCRFIWQYPSIVGREIFQNVQLLPFLEIQNRIRADMQYIQPNMPFWDGIQHRIIVIDRIELGMMRTNQQNSADSYMLIPVWDCFGYLIDHYDSQKESEYLLNEYNDAVIDENDGVGSFLTINALDGSIIDRNLGY